MKRIKCIVPPKYQYFSHPQIDINVRISVLKQLEKQISIYDNSGIYKQVEDALTKLFPVKYLLTVCNGTSALYSIFFGGGIHEGDEVIVPVYTFFATATPLFQLGAIPIMADCDNTGNISASEIEKMITKKTRAVIITHMWGIPCDMDAIFHVCKKYNLLLFEDCSHAHGALYKGHIVGSYYSDAAAWSLQGKKLITAGEGGFIGTNNREIFERAVLIGHFNKRAIKEIKLKENKPFAPTGCGGNFRMHPLGASILLPQLSKFSEQLNHRRETANMLREAIDELPGLVNIEISSLCKPSWYAYPFLFDEEQFTVTKEQFVEYLHEIGAMEVDIPKSTCPLSEYKIFRTSWVLFPSYKKKRKLFSRLNFNFPNAYLFHKRVIKLPTWYGEDRKEYVYYYISALRNAVNKFKK